MPSTESLLVEIRARINYESFYREFLPDVRRRGRELSARCPFHEDSDPSWNANAETGLWICRVPSCVGHEGGDFIAFMRRLGHSFPDAVRRAADHVGVNVAEAATTRAARLARENEAVDEDALIERMRQSMEEQSSIVNQPPTIHRAIVEAFHRELRDGERRVELLNWLFHNRGITLETVDAFDIGHNGQRYTIPIYENGEIVNIRQYRADAQNGQKMISWREGYGVARLFPFRAFERDETIYIMEGEWDCLLARQCGLNAITSTGGAGSWNPDWNYLFDEWDIVICYDNDDAGRAGALNVALNLVDVASQVRIFDWRYFPGGPRTMGMPDGYDFTDYVVRDHGTVAEFCDHVANLHPFQMMPPPEVPTIVPAVIVPPDDDPVNRSDVGNARRLARRHGGDVRYVSRNWYVWDGTRYALDETGEIDRRAKETARSILQEAMTCPNDDMREKLAAYSIASESASKIHAMIDLARSEFPLACRVSEMDTNPYLLNCTNGTYDFQMHEMRDHRREDLLTMSTNQPYDPSETSDAWTEFVRRTFDGNEAVIEFVQRAIGYSLIGITTEQVLFFCYGTGANGKSTFLETIRDVVGDYARTADFSTFATQRGGHSGPRNDIMRLRNARFVTAIEFDAGRALDEIVIKQLTGGDTISARRLYSESEEFRPTFTPWIAGNHKPIIKGTDEAIWRRLRLIPFNVTIPHGERDPHLRQRLMTDAPAILNWAIQGAEDWMRIGLRPPDEVLLATSAYRNEMDTVEPFLESRTIRDARAAVKVSALYQEYKRWAEDSGEDAISKLAFGLRCGEKGFEAFTRGGSQFRRGLRIRSNDDLLIPDEEPAMMTTTTNGTNPADVHATVHEREIPFEPRGPEW